MKHPIEESQKFSFDLHSCYCNSTNISKILKLKNSWNSSVSLNLSTRGKLASSKFLLLPHLYTFSSHSSQSYSSDIDSYIDKICETVFQKIEFKKNLLFNTFLHLIICIL